MSSLSYSVGMEMRIRSVPEKIWHEFKILCAKEKIPMNQKLIALMKEAIEKAKEGNP